MPEGWKAMKKRRVFLVVQSLLCVLTAGLLALGAVCLYLDGAAKQAQGGLFDYIFTRERAGGWLLAVLPVFSCALAMSIVGWVLGIRGGIPGARGGWRPDPGALRTKAVPQRADKKTMALRAAVLAAALILLVLGILSGGPKDVQAKGAAVCTECIGLE